MLSISAVAAVHISTLFIVLQFEELASSVKSMLPSEWVTIFIFASSFEDCFLFLSVLSFKHNDTLIVCTKILLSVSSFN